MADETNYFNSTKYYKDPGAKTYIESTDAMANKHQMVVSFQHEPSGRSLFFKAFIISFNESYTSDWVSEAVFGRADPIQHFKQTARRVALGLAIPAATFSEAYENLGKVGQLTQFLYPNYTAVGQATTLSQNPFVRLKIMNLLRKISADGGNGNGTTSQGSLSTSDRYESYKSEQDPNNGLLGAITNLSIVHNLENNDIGVLQKSGTPNTIFSKMIEINLDFTVVHETPLGWNSQGEFAAPLFPYGVNLESNYQKPEGEVLNASKEETDNTQQQEDIERAKLAAALDWMSDYTAAQAANQRLQSAAARTAAGGMPSEKLRRKKAAAQSQAAFDERYGGDRSGHAGRVEKYLAKHDPRGTGGDTPIDFDAYIGNPDIFIEEFY